ncbi:hypothetical protein L226DRAFT_538813 [Lentinus tigrinus ALCF2SS1-7]|uniref:Uncharacterized protein n=1 Tax=Lentinus tigrinus ALCF2SS1-6 TaxID=1328759 RepID=A0A5C2RTV9_9APHY|nr:hypothetical protein L227DRAFT_580977 [Lentinus tigrinus ALCF2SS1-6]RPD70566.1 hypothetical protein L226DRAFT_538813 [Lentinus tigrinus ALCF2SS1-7]
MPSHLPEDVLIPIFKQDWEQSCFCRCPQPDIAALDRNHACHWTRIMLVCREWRAVAVMTPSLWHVIHVDKSLKWLQISLPRTRTLPLDFIFRDSLLALDAIPIICAISHRIRKLALPEMTSGSFAVVRRTIFKEKLAALQELDLSITSAIGMMIRQAPLGFTPDRFPDLHTFRLSCFLIDFEPAAYHKLRRLDLRGCTVSAMFGGMYSYEQLIDMLAGCEALEELQLQQSISTIVLVNLPPEREHRVVPMSKMRRFVIWDKTPVVARFLSYIDLPIESSVRIVGTYDSRTDISTAVDAFVSLLPRDRSGFPILRAVTRADLAFFQTHAKLRAWRGDTKVTFKLRSSTDRKWEFYFNRGLREFRDIFAGAPLEELKLLGDMGAISKSATTWKDTFAAYPTLQRLLVSGYRSPVAMLRALVESPSTPDGSASMNVVVPSLRHIQLQYLPWYPDYVDTLVEILRRRKSLGAVGLDILDIEFLVAEEIKAKCEQSLSRHDEELHSLVGDFRHELELV